MLVLPVLAKIYSPDIEKSLLTVRRETSKSVPIHIILDTSLVQGRTSDFTHGSPIVHNVNASKMTPSTARLLVKATSKLSAASLRPSHQSIRAFSQTCLRQADELPAAPRSSLISRLADMNASSAPVGTSVGTPGTSTQNTMSDISRLLATKTISRATNQPSDSILGKPGAEVESYGPAHEPFHFHIYAHKHNTHITVTKPDRNAIVSMSAGQIGFKKSKRGTYDAAYQLCAYVLDKLNQGSWHRKITALEVVLRGFGPGRDAATKVLLGSEGRLLRPHIKKVSDGTRLKFGGTRSPKPKRLG